MLKLFKALRNRTQKYAWTPFFSRILKPEDASYWMPLPEQPKGDGHEKVVCIN